MAKTKRKAGKELKEPLATVAFRLSSNIRPEVLHLVNQCYMKGNLSECLNNALDVYETVLKNNLLAHIINLNNIKANENFSSAVNAKYINEQEEVIVELAIGDAEDDVFSSHQRTEVINERKDNNFAGKLLGNIKRISR